MTSYEFAKAKYAKHGIDAEKAEQRIESYFSINELINQ